MFEEMKPEDYHKVKPGDPLRKTVIPDIQKLAPTKDGAFALAVWNADKNQWEPWAYIDAEVTNLLQALATNNTHDATAISPFSPEIRAKVRVMLEMLHVSVSTGEKKLGDVRRSN